MSRHHIHYTKENLNEILNKPIQILLSKKDLKGNNKIIEGQISECLLASNPPNLPAFAIINTVSGEEIKLSFLEMEAINILE